MAPDPTDTLKVGDTCPSYDAFYTAFDVLSAVPGSMVMYVGPLACLRYSVVGTVTPGDSERSAYLVLSENDIVLGRTEECVSKAVDELFATRSAHPSSLFVFFSCDSAIAGLDTDSLERRIQDEHDGLAVRAFAVGSFVENGSAVLVEQLREKSRELFGDEIANAFGQTIEGAEPESMGA